MEERDDIDDDSRQDDGNASSVNVADGVVVVEPFMVIEQQLCIGLDCSEHLVGACLNTLRQSDTYAIQIGGLASTSVKAGSLTGCENYPQGASSRGKRPRL